MRNKIHTLLQEYNFQDTWSAITISMYIDIEFYKKKCNSLSINQLRKISQHLKKSTY